VPRRPCNGLDEIFPMFPRRILGSRGAGVRLSEQDIRLKHGGPRGRCATVSSHVLERKMLGLPPCTSTERSTRGELCRSAGMLPSPLWISKGVLTAGLPIVEPPTQLPTKNSLGNRTSVSRATRTPWKRRGGRSSDWNGRGIIVRVSKPRGVVF